LRRLIAAVQTAEILDFRLWPILLQKSQNAGDYFSHNKAREHYDKGIALYDPSETSALGDAVWSRHSGCYLVLSLTGLVVPWFSRCRTQRR
jgi:hypothetical protein